VKWAEDYIFEKQVEALKAVETRRESDEGKTWIV